MCIIVVKTKGSSFPSVNTIINCMDRNPDGFAMAWNGTDGKVHDFRTMDKKEAVKKYAELSSALDPQKTGFIFHARIATHGSKRVENCHCWVVDTKKGPMAFAHNGILRNVPNRDDMTDSETFLRDYFVPVLDGAGWDVAARMTKAIVGTSKFAFLFGDGHIALTGEYIKHAEKDAKGVCYYSNNSFAYCGSLFGYKSPSVSRSVHEQKNAYERWRMEQNRRPALTLSGD